VWGTLFRNGTAMTGGMLPRMEHMASRATPWQGQPDWKEALPPLFGCKMAHSRLQQVAQGDDPEELAETVTETMGSRFTPVSAILKTTTGDADVHSAAWVLRARAPLAGGACKMRLKFLASW
jgi:hypothetical protein